MNTPYHININDDIINKNDLLIAEDKLNYFKSKNLIPKIYEVNGSIYYIIQYDKQHLNNTTKKWRSVIFDNNFNLLCYSPPKSENLQSFIESNKEFIYQYFIEGTMINLFYDKNINKWECATRSTIGANVKFYQNSKKTFREMFFETFIESKINYDDLNKNFCYSFILQHEENRIVAPIKKNRIYLCECYEIYDWQIIPNNDNNLFEKYSFLRIPEIENGDNYKEIIETYAGNGTTDYKIMGVVLKNKYNGQRTKVRNPQYEIVRKLKGNQSKNQYNYLCLKKQNSVMTYLKYYPEHKKEFLDYRDCLYKTTQLLYKLYQECYIEKKNPLSHYSSCYKTHMYKLHHEIYLLKIKPQQLNMKLKDVIEYVNSLHPSLTMNMMNCKN